MSDNGVADPTGGAAPVDGGTPSPTPTPTPAPAGNNAAGDWERKERGLIAEAQKERQARQQYERELTAHRAQLDQAQKRIQALAGVNPRSEAEAEDEAVRQAFAAKFPHLAELTPEDIQAIRDNNQRSQQLEASTNAMWKKHTTQVLSSIHAKVAERLGGSAKELTEPQKQTLRREYIAFIEQGQIQGQDYIARHEDADEELLDEFLESFFGAWEEPIRRRVTSTEVGPRRPLPSGKGRSIATTGAKKIDFSNEKSVADAAVETFLSHGGRFGQ